ncbi:MULTISPECIES: LacI family DNA-binding transcriptional regulator [Nitrospirillum]|uniref:DNA-binding LacI/PurR family transcriptional regulator n=1 Tax=Nitrospirillum amazonense TaxID=28077 RepID=A0A560FZ35_9PROT|nr:LacI family DNA-binding transcriptional regulator [Nitrospirillum amazonense]MEC4592474.1 LacI family DNA-binding transcriptional regulator [Nitrospirillum amazonense]TWB26849.1 DNA-binding LacI/PurR family transcriptional regulator [Nitrospirillum amazonense]
MDGNGTDKLCAPLPANPTISDVAERAGVSRAVASRALSDEQRPVSAEKKARVLQAAQELGFRPNLLARSLTTKSVNLVAVVVNHIHDLSDLDLFDPLLAAVQNMGKQVIFIRVGSSDRVESFLRTGVAYHVDAAIVFSDFADAATARTLFRSDQVLMLNGRHDDQSPAVIPDERVGIAEAMAHAARQGVKSAALVTGRLTSALEQARIRLYQAALAAQGIRLMASLQGDYSYASGHKAGEELALTPRPDAIFCTSDAMAMGVLDRLRADFPQGRATTTRLYGFDNLSLMDFDAYPISSIGYDKQAYVAAVIAVLTGAATGPWPLTLPTRFHPRLTG